MCIKMCHFKGNKSSEKLTVNTEKGKVADNILPPNMVSH